MQVEAWTLVASTLFAAVAAGASAWQTIMFRREKQHQLGQTFEDRFNPLNERFLATLGGPADGIEPPEFRTMVVELVVLYGQVYRASRLGLFPDDQWEGLRASFTYWLRRPVVAEAWRQLAKQDDSWPDGFVEFVNDELARPPSKAERLWDIDAASSPLSAEPSVDADAPVVPAKELRR